MATVTLFVSSAAASSERRFRSDITLGELKGRLEAIVGVPPSDQRLVLYTSASGEGGRVASLEGPDETPLSTYPIRDTMRLEVNDVAGAVRGREFTDTSLVDKYEMSSEEYAKRDDSVMAFKMRNKIGRFAEDGGSVKSGSSLGQEEEEKQEEAAKALSPGDRCEVEAEGMEKRGTIRYVGTTDFKSGVWVGVEYDEPLGKHAGKVGDRQYFSARPKHGAFVRPLKIRVGDYPEEDFDDLDEM